MEFSHPSLHPPVLASATDMQVAEARMSELLATQPALAGEVDEMSDFIEIPLTTISLGLNFDSFISVGLRSSDTSRALFPLLFDTGNTVLVLPWWEDIEALPDWQSNYEILCTGKEPWGCPANVVKGPIEILTRRGQTYLLKDCIFFACTGVAEKNGTRTANFGAGRVTSPTMVCSNQPMLSPLQYNTALPFAEINLAPAEDILDATGGLRVAVGSFLRLHKELPADYSLFDIVPDQDWMSLVPLALTIGKVKSGWPGHIASPIAMIDTGGGAANLSDPGGHLSNRQWPDEVPNPGWVKYWVNGCHGSKNCKSVKTDITLELGDASGASFTYEIDTRVLPAPVRGLTLVMCEKNCFMEGQNGMNIGGVSALSIRILIDYQNARVGLKLKK